MTTKREPGWYWCDVRIKDEGIDDVVSNEYWNGEAFVDAEGNPRTDREYVRIDEQRNN